MSEKTDLRCTFHRDGQWCGLPQEEESVHVWPNERMRAGAHVWRHDQRDEAGLEASEAQEARLTARSEEYQQGYQAGFHAGQRSRSVREKCDHKGIGLPWCPICGPRTRAALAERGVEPWASDARQAALPTP